MSVNKPTLIAASSVALGLVGLGVVFGGGTAAADGTHPDTGSYDELLDIQRAPNEAKPDTGSYDELLNILDDDGFQADRP